MFQSLAFLFHVKNFKSPNKTVYYATLKDPLLYGFQLSLDSCFLDLLRQGFFHQVSPTAWSTQPFWSLQKDLDHFSPDFSPPFSMVKYEMAFFLTALASDLCSSQLFALMCQQNWTAFSLDGSLVSLAPSPTVQL